MQRFTKGRTFNHLTWVMVDSTDFATPESNCSNITTIKIYGKLRSSSNVHFVSSGTGSLTEDITHVGASATGIYTIALAKADLSDASAAWYDQYVIALSATGSARQTLVVDGGIDESNLLVLSDAVSNVYSAVGATLDIASDAHSAAVQTNSRVLLNQSRISDIGVVLSSLNSEFLSRVPSLVPTASGLSAVTSDIQSMLSDFYSDFQSRVPKAAATASMLSDLYSDFQSRVPKAVATASGVSAVTSDIQSYLVAMSGSLSDVESQIDADAAVLSSLNSEFLSRVPSLVPTASGLSAVISDVQSYLVAMSASLSDVQSAVAAIPAAVTTTAMTEAYSTDGGTKTVAQALYEIHAMLAEASVSGTTLTVKKVDGSTTAMTFTLNDATTPTSITRAT